MLLYKCPKYRLKIVPWFKWWWKSFGNVEENIWHVLSQSKLWIVFRNHKSNCVTKSNERESDEFKMMSKITNKKINEGDNQLHNESTKLQKNEER